MTKKQHIAIMYRVLFISCCASGLLLTTGVIGKGFNPEVVNYYTIWAIGLGLFYFIFLLVNNFLHKRKKVGENENGWFAHFKGAITIALTITMLVYNFVLLPNLSTMGNYKPFTLTDILIHYAIPIMVILDWILFDKKGVYSVFDPLKWLIFPFAYLAFVMVKASFGYVIEGISSKYPYFFINIDKLGAAAVTYNVLLLVLVFLAVGYLLWFIDKQAWWKKNYR
jgi:hypothetical protein